jgi:hypothetical protein
MAAINPAARRLRLRVHGELPPLGSRTGAPAGGEEDTRVGHVLSEGDEVPAPSRLRLGARREPPRLQRAVPVAHRGDRPQDGLAVQWDHELTVA